jgi:uncharacterized protein (DUF3084 family)
LLGGVVFLVSSNHKLINEVTELREASNQMQALRADLEQIKTTGSPAQAEQIARLSKDNQDLPKLRKEVHQLREDKKLLGQQAQTAQAQVQAAQSHIATLSTDLQSAQARAQQQVLVTHQQEWANACLNNLLQLDGAKQQWALEGNKTAHDIPTEKDLAPYLKDGIPKCPAGGTYTIKAADTVRGSHLLRARSCDAAVNCGRAIVSPILTNRP